MMPTVLRAIGLASSLGALAAGASAAQPRPTTRDWSAPAIIAGVKGPVRWPSLTFSGDTAWVAGIGTPANTTVPDRPLVIVRIPGSPVAPPPGAFQFVFPKLIAGPGGVIHMVWAEFAAPRREVSGWTSSQKTLWHSAWSANRWSAPERIAAPRALQWDDTDGRLAVDGAGRLRVITWAGDGGVDGFLFLTLAGNEWETETLPLATLNNEMGIAASGDSTWIAVTESARRSGDTAGLSLTYRASTRMPWTKFRLGTDDERVTVLHPELVTSRGDRYMVWGEVRWNTVGVDTIRIARVRGGQATRLLSIQAPPSATRFSVAGNPCGGVTVAVETIGKSPDVAMYDMSSDGKLTAYRLAAGGKPAFLVAMAASSQEQRIVFSTAGDASIAFASSKRRLCS